MICAKSLAVLAGIVLTQNVPMFGPEDTGAGLMSLANSEPGEKGSGPTANGAKAIDKDASSTQASKTSKTETGKSETSKTSERSRDSKTDVDCDAALKLLQDGNERWVLDKTQNPNDEPSRRASLSEQGQNPVATIITCADSRLPVERIFDRGVGELFVIRVAGNVAGDSETGTIEYGVEHLHTPLLVVMGHTKCGAVAAATGDKLPAGALGRLVSHISPAVDRARKGNPGTDSKELATFAVRENVWQTVFDLLKNSDEIRTAVKSGQLRVVGAVCDISTGKVNWMGEHPWQSEIVAALDTKGDTKTGERTAHAEESH